MRIAISAKGMELTDAIQDVTVKKFSTLSKLIQKRVPEDLVLNIELGKESRHHGKGDIFFAEARLNWGSINIYSHLKTDDLYSAIEAVVKECKRQFTSTKGKLLDKERKVARSKRD